MAHGGLWLKWTLVRSLVIDRAVQIELWRAMTFALGCCSWLATSTVVGADATERVDWYGDWWSVMMGDSIILWSKTTVQSLFHLCLFHQSLVHTYVCHRFLYALF